MRYQILTSIILLINWVNEYPEFFAAIGSKLVDVIPGRVFNSKKWYSPLSNMKSNLP